MKDSIELDICPIEEEVVQVMPDTNYMPAMRAEAVRFKNMLLERFVGFPVTFKIKSNPHDFGTYLSIAVVYEDGTPCSERAAFFIDNHMPEKWDDTKVYTMEDVLKELKSEGEHDSSLK
jgi:hypothetical protein